MIRVIKWTFDRIRQNKSIEKGEESRSYSTLYSISMNLWSNNEEQTLNHKPMLIFEDGIKFLRSKEQTFKISEKVLDFLMKNNVRWDLLYLHYRMIEATCIYEIPHQPSISLWCASHVISNAGYIINTNPRTIQNLIKCMTNYLSFKLVNFFVIGKSKGWTTTFVTHTFFQDVYGKTEKLKWSPSKPPAMSTYEEIYLIDNSRSSS